MQVSLLAVALVVLATPVIAAPPPTVVMYGADWCGPCRTVRQFLDNQHVPYRYLDIGDEANYAQFAAVNDGRGGIPLVIVGTEKVRGANLKRLAQVLAPGGVATDLQVHESTGGEVYGGHAVSWWQRQFSSLRQHLKSYRARVETYRKNAQYREDFERLQEMEKQQKLIEQALDQLESDASDVAVPRQYRMYD